MRGPIDQYTIAQTMTLPYKKNIKTFGLSHLYHIKGLRNIHFSPLTSALKQNQQLPY